MNSIPFSSLKNDTLSFPMQAFRSNNIPNKPVSRRSFVFLLHFTVLVAHLGLKNGK